MAMERPPATLNSLEGRFSPWAGHPDTGRRGSRGPAPVQVVAQSLSRARDRLHAYSHPTTTASPPVTMPAMVLQSSGEAS